MQMYDKAAQSINNNNNNRAKSTLVSNRSHCSLLSALSDYFSVCLNFTQVRACTSTYFELYLNVLVLTLALNEKKT